MVEPEIDDDPIARVLAWVTEAEQTAAVEPRAMTVATVDEDGYPSARVVLLRGLDVRGFVFFTNLESRKGRELKRNPHAAICLYFDALRRQVRARGVVEQVSAAEADAYFRGRERGSQIGAWASLQSEPLAHRDELLARYAAYEAQFPGEVPRPPHWSGLRLVPGELELWSGQESRLHVRELYQREGDRWRRSLLFP